MGINIEKIKSRRMSLGLTQETAGKRAGYSKQFWNNIETGERTNLTIETLENIAKALKVSAKDLLK